MLKAFRRPVPPSAAHVPAVTNGTRPVTLGQGTMQCGWVGWPVTLASPTPVDHLPVEWPDPTPWSPPENIHSNRYEKVTQNLEPG